MLAIFKVNIAADTNETCSSVCYIIIEDSPQTIDPQRLFVVFFIKANETSVRCSSNRGGAFNCK